MSIGMRDTNEHMIAGIIGIIPHKVAVLIILSTLTLEINRISRFVHVTIFSAALPVGILISIGTVYAGRIYSVYHTEYRVYIYCIP